MALQTLRLKENVKGDFFVDNSCIDCDLCRQIAPQNFHDIGDKSAVYKQPETDEEEFEALKALVTCPTASIGALGNHDVKRAVAAFPEVVEGSVYFCGFAAESSFGASSYLIVRPEGNVLVDSPRFANPLVRRIEELGGIKLMFLTHRDDIADHQQWSGHFQAQRVMHAEDLRGLRFKPEQEISGRDAVSLGKDLVAIPTPGHTRGHMVLLFQNRYLFTGDHLWWSENYQSLHASRNVNWYSWPEQIRSVERLLDFEFEWVLPGHGRRAHADSKQMHAYLRECLSRMKRN